MSTPIASWEDPLFWRAVSHFNGRRYWHARSIWTAMWAAAAPDERDLLRGLAQVAAGLYHLERRSRRAALGELEEGLGLLRRYGPVHGDLDLGEALTLGQELLAELRRGGLPYLIPPVLKRVEHPVSHLA